MSQKRRKFQEKKEKLFNKRRFIIFNEDTLAETFSLKLTLMNVFIVATLGAILIIFVTTFIIAFTPLREYIPGYASTKLKEQATLLTIKSDSLLKVSKENNMYINSIKAVLNGDLEYAKLNKDSIQVAENTNKESYISVSEKEIELRNKVAKDNKYNVFEKAKPKVSYVLFAPVSGKIVKNYNIATKNLGVNIAVAKGTPIKAIAAGTIIFSDWTPSNGFVVIIRHEDDVLSVYKNLSSITKYSGNNVKSSEVIAISGDNTPQNSIHFQLWKNGIPINPTQFINFD
jgi:murein DD-endopeptidase MepM/ murein hydrolase activator NlpD